MQCTPEQIEQKRLIALQRLKNNKSKQQYVKPYSKPMHIQKRMFKTILKCALKTTERFYMEMSQFDGNVVEVFKIIPSKYYDNRNAKWDFDLKHYELLIDKLKQLEMSVHVERIPSFIMSCLSKKHLENIEHLERIDENLLNTLMPFQLEGVKFGIQRNGRCFIADDMGLGKTFQALALAHYYVKDWPLLISTTASMKNVWEATIQEYLLSVPLMYLQYMTTAKDYIGDSKIVIVTHELMIRCEQKLLQRKFGVIIFDESHNFKNPKARCTQVAQCLAHKAQRVILLSGTPALSRPSELYSQLSMIDNKFFGGFRAFAQRYCDAKMGKFGWDVSGNSNLKELEIILYKVFLIRRTKEQILDMLPNKIQEVIDLDVKLDNLNEDDHAMLNAVTKNYNTAQSSQNKHQLLLNYFQKTAVLKIRPVCSYILRLLDDYKDKFLIFAHHQKMLDAICEILNKRNVLYIRIDGGTLSERRKQYIEQFQFNDEYQIAVLSITATNTGVTLTSAKMVLFAELHWNPSILSQAESRAHRIGQRNTVVIRYLRAPHTADNAIWELLQKKQQTLQSVGLCKDSFKDIKLVHDIARTSNDIRDYFSKESNTSTDALLNDGCDDLFLNIDL